MARKTVSEYSKSYRERQKEALGEEWLSKECDRVRKYYKPVCEMTPAELKRSRDKRKKKKAEYRKKLKERKEALMVVKLDFSNKSADGKKRTRRRVSRSGSKAKREMDKMKKKNSTLKRNNWRLQKQIQRMKEKENDMRCRKLREKNNPKEKAVQDLIAANLDPKKHPQLLKKLIAHHALNLQMKLRNEKKMKKSKKSVEGIISGSITKKYRVLSYLGYETGTNRNRLGKSAQKIRMKKRRQPKKRDECAEKIRAFFNRDDVSQIKAGKADHKKKHQTRILNDYLRNLWKKFVSETGEHVSLPDFCRSKPGYILLTKLTNRRTCLCRKHQNLALKLQAINRSWTSPDYILTQKTDEDILSGLESATNIKYHSWEKHTTADKVEWRCEKKEDPKDDFISQLKEDLLDVREHVRIISEQYQSMGILKNSLEKNEVLVQMDFAENFKCRSRDELQENYWHVTQATVHPVVIYYRNKDGDLHHENNVYISPVQQHNPSVVYCILEKINQELTSQYNGVQKVYYWTDSPASQYRNRTIAHVIGNHQHYFGREATWGYYESGHGKSVCDGIGGTFKRMATEAVNQGKTVITDAHDLFDWGNSRGDASLIKCHLYTQEDVDLAEKQVKRMKPDSIPGIQIVHCIVGVVPGVVVTRTTCCFCPDCKSGNFKCEGWKLRKIRKEEEKKKKGKNSLEEPRNLRGNKVKTEEILTLAGNMVAAIYEKKAYVGKVLKNDFLEGQVYIDFMVTNVRNRLVKWPEEKDLLWVPYEDILCNIGYLEQNDPPKNEYIVQESDLIKMRSALSKKLQKK